MREFIWRKITLTFILVAVLLSQSVSGTIPSNPSAQAAGIPTASENREYSAPYEPAQDVLSVLFINVGKADAVLLRYAEEAWLIDTGGKESVPGLFGAMSLFGVKALDGVFLTHTHNDHIGGMEALAENYSVHTLYSSVFSQDKKNGGNRIDELAENLSLTHQKLRAGDRVEIIEDVFFEVLGPVAFNAEDDNDNSLVMRLRVNGRTLLFTGDMQFAGEDALLSSGADLVADVLKVGHHGKPDATSKMFAAAVSPKYAVISTDTLEDEDSANDSVLTALRGAEVFITENYACGVLIIVHADGSVEVSDLDLPEAQANINVTDINRDTQTITVRNMGPDADISGFIVMSQRGYEVFVFPEDSWLKAGQSVSVSNRPGADFVWPDESTVWHREKDDSALLFDRFGNFLTRGD